jgi:hypothetical protein
VERGRVLTADVEQAGRDLVGARRRLLDRAARLS